LAVRSLILFLWKNSILNC